MGNIDIVVILLIGVTALVSWQGWENPNLFDRLKFQMSAITQGREYDRMITSAFLHADSFHLIFNMFALYVFAPVILNNFSTFVFLFIYFVSILGGSLLSILFHKNEPWYSAVGASGGVSGIVFAAIAVYPQMPLQLIFLPFFSFPGWVFGLAYLGYSIFGMKNRMGNVGHAAHLGGSIAGMLMAISFAPELLSQNGMYIAVMAVPVVVLSVMAWKEIRQ